MKLEKIFFEKAKISSVWLLKHLHFVRKPSISIHIVFPRYSSGGGTLEAQIMQVKEKHKYRPQNLIRFHLQDRSFFPKHPLTLPTSKNTHWIDNVLEVCHHLPPGRSWAFFFGSITVSGAWRCKCGQIVEKFPRKRKYLERYCLLSENFPLGWTVPFEFSPELPKISCKRSKFIRLSADWQWKLANEFCMQLS